MCGFRQLQSDGCFWLWLSCKISGIEDQKLDLPVDRVAKWHSVPVKRSTPSLLSSVLGIPSHIPTSSTKTSLNTTAPVSPAGIPDS